MIQKLYSNLFLNILKPFFKIVSSRPIQREELPEIPKDLDVGKSVKGKLPVALHGPFQFLFSLVMLAPPKGSSLPKIRNLTFTTLFFMCCRVGVSLIPPYLLYQIILFFTEVESGAPLTKGVLLVLALCLVALAEGLVISHYFLRSEKISIHLRNFLNLGLYQQILRLSKSQVAQDKTGEILSYSSSDTTAVADLPVVLIEFCHDLLVIISVSWLLFSYLGIAALAPLMLMLLLAPVTKKTSNKFSKIDTERRNVRDERVSIISQTISAIRLVKFFVWEKTIAKEVNQTRKKELDICQSHVTATATSFAIYGSIRVLTALLGFGTFALMGNDLTPALVFPCLALFKMLEHPFGDATFYIADIMGAKVSIHRIFGFLKRDIEISKEGEQNLGNRKTLGSREILEKGDKNLLQIQDLSIQLGSVQTPLLSQVNLEISPGEKVALVGSVGSGKTILLESILGELPYQGTIRFQCSEEKKSPSMVYTSQNPFIMNATIEENIVFGRSGNLSSRVLEDTCLDQDLTLFPQGIQTEIGENGVNLSGGQKQRVALARAAFQPADLVLLDDPFSALDPSTEQLVIKRLLSQHWKDSTVLLTTHRFHCLAQMDKIVFLADGKIEATGSLKTLLRENSRFQSFYAEHEKEEKKKIQEAATLNQEQKKKQLELQKESPLEEEEASASASFMAKEDREFGGVKKQVYLQYFQKLCESVKPIQQKGLLISLALVSILASIVPIVQDLWLAFLASDNSTGIFQKNLPEWMKVDLFTSLEIYGVLGFLALLCLSLSHWLWMKRALKAAQKLHDGAWKGVLFTNVRFFDTNPAGRIINRFSEDMDEVDMGIGENFKGFIFAIVEAFTRILFMVIVVPSILILLPILAIMSKNLQLKYLVLSRDLKRLDSVTQSPKVAFFRETLLGAEQVRAFGQEENFYDRFWNLLRNHHQILFYRYILRWWYLIQNSLINAILIAGVSVGCLFFIQWGWLSTSISGLVLTYAMTFTYVVPQIFEHFGDVQNQMTAVERLDHYQSLQPEETLQAEETLRTEETLQTEGLLQPEVKLQDGVRLPPSWPSQGKVEFKKVKARYDSSLPLTLKEVSFQAEEKKRLGIIGRTGSGKSTIFQALCRLIEIDEGEILIDGVDIAKIPLSTLRSQLAMVPQDPILFSGTVRSNLDRERQWTDAEIFKVLTKVQLNDFIHSLPDILDTKIEENGKNLSQGQRQLICLARALLLDTKIILMDEATASLDLETEKYLHQAMEESLQDKTVLLIAHRPESVQHCDSILELSAGRNISTSNVA